jgi:hypothetical protein
VDADELIRQIRAKAVAAGPLPPPASREMIKAVEGRLGLRLPGLLVSIYIEIADGGFGPGSDVPIAGYPAARLYSLQDLERAYRDNLEGVPGSPWSPWPDGVVPMLSWGCFAEAAIDCLDDQTPVLLYESDVDEVTPAQAWKVDAPSLDQWWWRWVNGVQQKPTQPWRRKR